MSCAEATAGPDLHFQEGAQPPMEGRGAARHQAGFEDLEQLLSRCAEADRALHVRHEAGLFGPAEREERDGDELADLCRDVLALSQAQLVDSIIGLDELRVLPGRELPLGIDVAPRLLHPRDQLIRPALVAVVPFRRDHLSTSWSRRV